MIKSRAESLTANDPPRVLKPADVTGTPAILVEEVVGEAKAVGGTGVWVGWEKTEAGVAGGDAEAVGVATLCARF